MADSKLAVERIGDVVIVRPMDRKVSRATNMDSVVELLRQLVDQQGCEKLVIDLSEVTFLCSAALNHLIVLDRRLKQRGGHLRICNPRPEITELLTITRLDSVFSVISSQAEAVASLNA